MIFARYTCLAEVEIRFGLFIGVVITAVIEYIIRIAGQIGIISRVWDEKGTCNRLRFRLFFSSSCPDSAKDDRGVPPAGVCTVSALADVNHIQNDRHRRIHGIRLATW